MKFDPNDLMQIRNVIGRDLQVSHGMSGDHWRGPIKSISMTGNTVSFDCEWLVTRETNHGPWTLAPGKTLLNDYPITSVDSDDLREADIIIVSPVAYLYVRKPGDSLEKPV